MLRWAGFPRIVLRRAFGDWPFTLAAWLILACAITMLVGTIGYAQAIATGSLRQAIEQAPAPDRGVTVRASVDRSHVEAVDGVVTDLLSRDLAGTKPEIVLDLRSRSLVLTKVETTPGTDESNAKAILGQPVASRMTLLASYGNLETHGSAVEGRWPYPGAQPFEATVSEAAARRIGLRVGDVVTLGDASVPIAEGKLPPAVAQVAIVGIWRPDREDPYWLADPLDLDGTATDGTNTTVGPILLARADLERAGALAGLDLRWRAIPSLDSIEAGQVDTVRQNVEALPFQLSQAFAVGTITGTGTGLAAVLDTAGEKIAVSQSNVAILALLFAVLAIYAIVLVAGMLAERRRLQLVLLRARGASVPSVAAVAVGEAILLAVPAAVVAPFAALPLVAGVTRAGPLANAWAEGAAGVTAENVSMACAGGLLGAIVLAAPDVVAVPSLATLRAELARPLSRTLPQRLGLDVVLAVVAAVGLWQLHGYTGTTAGSGSGSAFLRFDPLLLAAPAIGLLAGAVLATRLVPRLGEVAERLLGHGRGLLPSLVSTQLARRPLRYSRAALLLVLAVALSTFAVVYASSWAESQSAQASYAAGADVRATATTYTALTPWGVRSVLRGIPGVAEAVPATRERFDLGRKITAGTLFSIDGTEADGVARFPSRAASASAAAGFDTLAAHRPGTASFPISGRPTHLVVILDANLEHASHNLTEDFPIKGGSFDPGQKGVEVTLALIDGDGRLQQFTGDTALLSGTGQRLDVPLLSEIAGGTLAPAYPLRLEAIGLEVATNGVPAEGSINLRGLDACDGADSSSCRSVSFDPGATGWSWTRQDGTTAAWSRTESPVVDASHPGRIDARTGTSSEWNYSPMSWNEDTLFRLWAPPSTSRVPVLASSRFLEVSGLNVGSSATISASAGEKLQIDIIGEMPEFPTLDPATPFLVADLASRDMARFAGSWNTLAASEWWLAVEPGREAAVAQALAAEPFHAQSVVVATQLDTAYRSEPIALGVLGALLIGSLGALAFAILGIVATAMVAARERLGELALLQAVGLSSRQLHAALALEQAFVVAVGLVSGLALGLLLGWLVVPFAVQGQLGAPAVPRPEVVVPLVPLLTIAAAAAAVFIAVAALLVRQLPARQLAATLRTWEG